MGDVRNQRGFRHYIMLPVNVISSRQWALGRLYPVKYMIYLPLPCWAIAKNEINSQSIILMLAYRTQVVRYAVLA